MDVIVKKPGTVVPGGTQYVVGNDGTYLQLDQWWMKAVVRVTECPLLEKVESSIELRLPPIDAVTFAKAARFFAKVYKLHGTEAYMLLHFSEEQGYALSVPKQEVSPSTVRADMKQRLDGYRCVGTIHSHGDMEAYHSSVDRKSEEDFDGIHITIGRVTLLPYVSVDAEVSVRGSHWKLPPSFIEGLEVISYRDLPLPSGIRSWQEWYRWQNIRHRCAINAAKGWTIPPEWIGNVSLKRVTAWRSGLSTTVASDIEGVSIVPRFVKALQRRLQKWNPRKTGV